MSHNFFIALKLGLFKTVLTVNEGQQVLKQFSA